MEPPSARCRHRHRTVRLRPHRRTGHWSWLDRCGQSARHHALRASANESRHAVRPVAETPLGSLADLDAAIEEDRVGTDTPLPPPRAGHGELPVTARRPGRKAIWRAKTNPPASPVSTTAPWAGNTHRHRQSASRRYPARLRALSRPARPHARPVRHHRGSTSLDAGYFASPSGTAQHRRGIGWRRPKPGEGWLTKRNISASGQRTAPPPDPPDADRPRPRSIRLSGIRLVSGPMPAAPSRRNARKAPTDSTRGPPATRGRTTRNGWTLRRQ